MSGHCLTGTLTGVLGPSGSGKTTLLNILSGNSAPTSGHIYLGSHLKAASPVSYYIQQQVQESIVGELKVREILEFAYAFKNEQSSTSERVDEHIKQTMSALLLPLDLLTRRFEKCSGGEQRRISLAQELMTLTSPDFIFCDEVTTGLDSASAFEVIFCLQQLAKNRQITIIVTIHAPNSETLKLFDNVMVLSIGGNFIFTGVPSEIKSKLFNTISFSENPPIEELLKIACNGNDSQIISTLATDEQVNESAFLDCSSSSLIDQPYGFLCIRKAFCASDFFTSLLRQLKITFSAQLKIFLFLPIIFIIYFAFVSSVFAFSGTKRSRCLTTGNTSNSVCAFIEDPLQLNDAMQKNIYFISQVIFFVGILILNTTMELYSKHLKVLKSEHRNYWYSIGVYYWSANIISFLELNFSVLLVSVLSYFFSGQHLDEDHFNWSRFAIYSFYIWLLCTYYQAVGQLVGSILIDNPLIGLLFIQIIGATFILFNGLFIKLHRTGSALLEEFGNALGLVFITRGLFYSIFVFEKCHGEGEFSKVVVDHQIEVEKLGMHVLQVVGNVLIVKLATFLVLYVKFNKWKRKIPNLKNANNHNENSAKIKFVKTKKEESLNMFPVKVIGSIENQFFKNEIVIAWRNLTLFANNSIYDFSTDLSNHQEPILSNLSGHLRYNTINAVLGSSGSGKTSLLRVLNGQCKTRVSDKTEIYLSKLTQIRTCFITQEVSGHLMKGLTGKQLLLYASKLKNAQSPSVDHEKVALKWLQELNILQTADTPVDRCSGGEKKRIAAALELVNVDMPNLVIVDEIISGLDTHSALVVIETLRKVATTHPLTIVTSIHQPTVQILNQFNQLFILARGGVCIFNGKPHQMNQHLEQVPELFSQTTPPIETLIKQSCAEWPNELTSKLNQLTEQSFANFEKAELDSQTYLTLDGVQTNRQRFNTNSVLQLSLRYLQYIRFYLWKEWLAYLLVSIAFGVNLRVLFSPDIIRPNGCINIVEDDLTSCHRTTKQIQDEFLLLDNFVYVYYSVNIYMFVPLLYSTVTLFNEFSVLQNEHRNGWYNTGAFFLTKSLLEIIPMAATNFVYIAIINIYEPVVQSNSIYWPLFLVLTLSQLAYISLGHLFTLIGGNNFTLILILESSAFIFMMDIGNAYIPVPQMHYIWQILSTFSIPRFTFETVMLLLYGFGRCANNEPNIVLYTLNIDDGDYVRNIGTLILLILFFQTLAFYMLIRRVNPIGNRQKRVARIVKHQERMKRETMMKI